MRCVVTSHFAKEGAQLHYWPLVSHRRSSLLLSSARGRTQGKRRKEEELLGSRTANEISPLLSSELRPPDAFSRRRNTFSGPDRVIVRKRRRKSTAGYVAVVQ